MHIQYYMDIVIIDPMLLIILGISTPPQNFKLLTKWKISLVLFLTLLFSHFSLQLFMTLKRKIFSTFSILVTSNLATKKIFAWHL